MIKKTFIPIFLLIFLSYNPANAQDAFIGEIKMFAGNFAPRGWAFCEGQLLPIAQNTALFSILGTTYGGDGRTSFGLPDLRGRAPIGPGNGPGLASVRQGAKGGKETIVLNATQMPPINHDVPAFQLDPNNTSDQFNPGNQSLLSVGNEPNSSVKTNNTGGSQAINNRPPYLGMRYIIAIQGTFPSRS